MEQLPHRGPWLQPDAVHQWRETTQVIDRDKKTRRADGLLAFQLHAGPPMTVQFKNVRIKELPKRVRKAVGKKGKDKK